jgi:hypothetical protein
MSAIKLRGLSMSEAEEAIAELWSCLEEYGIPSPKLKATCAHKRITIELSALDDPLWAKLVDTRLSNLRCGKMERTRIVSTRVDRERKRFLEMENAATMSFPRMDEMPLGAIAEISRAKRRQF